MKDIDFSAFFARIFKNASPAIHMAVGAILLEPDLNRWEKLAALFLSGLTAGGVSVANTHLNDLTNGQTH